MSWATCRSATLRMSVPAPTELQFASTERWAVMPSATDRVTTFARTRCSVPKRKRRAESEHSMVPKWFVFVSLPPKQLERNLEFQMGVLCPGVAHFWARQPR